MAPVPGTTAIFAIGALGLNILTGLAGQVSLGHAFFMAIGAYTAAWLGGPVDGPLLGLGLPIWIWLPAAGIVAALIGVAIGPTAVRVRGLYLAIVTLGLVFIGEYVWRNWASLTGGAQVGRDFPPLQFRIWKEDPPLFDLTTPSTWFGVEVSATGKAFLFLTLVAADLRPVGQEPATDPGGPGLHVDPGPRTSPPRSWGSTSSAYKLLAFGLSSFYAGIAGALLASFVTRVVPERWDLFLSVQFIAIVLIGGAGTVTGALLGTAFVVLLPRIVQNFTLWLEATATAGEGHPGRDCRRVHVHLADRLRADQHSGGGRSRSVGGPTQPGALWPVDHRVPHLRASRSLRDLASHTQLLEGLAVHLLSGHDGGSSAVSTRRKGKE